MAYLFYPSSEKFFPKIKIINNIKNRKILAFAPHSDDLSVGAGGFLSILAKNNDILPVLAFTGWRGVKGNLTKDKAIKIREEEMKREAKVLNIKRPIFLRLLSYEKENQFAKNSDKRAIKKLILEKMPHIIFLPNKKDLHPRHRMLTEMVLEILKKLKFSCELFFYEVPWSVFSGKEFNFIVPLNDEAIKKKIEAIKVHKSQLKRTNFVKLAKALFTLRAGMVPEQKIWGYGSSNALLENAAEVYKYQIMKFKK